jgi:hypothetical protein
MNIISIVLQGVEDVENCDQWNGVSLLRNVVEVRWTCPHWPKCLYKAHSGCTRYSSL